MSVENSDSNKYFIYKNICQNILSQAIKILIKANIDWCATSDLVSSLVLFLDNLGLKGRK